MLRLIQNSFMHGNCTYTPELAKQICDLVSEGLSCRKAGDQLGIPNTTVRNWLCDFPEFAAQYAKASENRADFFFEKMVERADKITGPGDAQVARVQIDTIKWACSKLLPKRYGEKVDLEHSGQVAIKRIVDDL